jgi:hypothetical protein
LPKKEKIFFFSNWAYSLFVTKLKYFQKALVQLASRKGSMERLGAKKLILIGVFLFGLYVLVLAQQENLSKARIFLPDTRWDFGYVPKGSSVSHIFQIKNTGEDTLIIVRVRPGCGCTTVPLFKDRLAPKETADLEVIFDSEKIRPGKASKGIQIISNDPTKPFQDLYFTASVGETNSLVKLVPEEVFFDTIHQEKETKRTVTLENISEEKLSVDLIEGPKDFVELNIERRSLKPHEKTQITLGLIKNAPPGNFRSSFTLDFQNSKMVRITVPIHGVVATK